MYVCMYVYYTYTDIIELCNKTLLYIYNRSYTYTYIKELCQQVFIYNEEAQCTSYILSAQVLELS